LKPGRIVEIRVVFSKNAVPFFDFLLFRLLAGKGVGTENASFKKEKKGKKISKLYSTKYRGNKYCSWMFSVNEHNIQV